MNKLTPILIAGSLAISAGLAFAQTQIDNDEPMQGHSMPGIKLPDTPEPSSDNPSTKAYIAANYSMHKDMTVGFTGDADVDFMHGMIPHHQGAIDMAKIVLEYGQDPEVRKLAQQVIKAQDGEIAIMKRWLAGRAE